MSSPRTAPTPDRVFYLLDEGHVGSAIIKVTGLPRSTVYDHIQRLIRDGYFRKLERTGTPASYRRTRKPYVPLGEGCPDADRGGIEGLSLRGHHRARHLRVIRAPEGDPETAFPWSWDKRWITKGNVRHWLVRRVILPTDEGPVSALSVTYMEARNLTIWAFETVIKTREELAAEGPEATDNAWLFAREVMRQNGMVLGLPLERQKPHYAVILPPGYTVDTSGDVPELEAETKEGARAMSGLLQLPAQVDAIAEGHRRLWAEVRRIKGALHLTEIDQEVEP